MQRLLLVGEGGHGGTTWKEADVFRHAAFEGLKQGLKLLLGGLDGVSGIQALLDGTTRSSTARPSAQDVTPGSRPVYKEA